MNKILITGVSGQDGAWLAKKLIDEGNEVYGTIRRGASPKLQRLEYLNIIDRINFVTCEISEFNTVFDVINSIKPDQIYNMAAQSFVAESFNNPIMTNKINYTGVLNILETIRILGIDCAVYQASSSEMFGEVLESPQNERTNFNPMSPYGVSKAAAHYIVANYRKAYGMKVCSGILFNHESELRGKEFVTRKISSHMAELANGRERPIELGNISAMRDWGYAPEYMDAVELILNNKNLDDYVVSTNTIASIKDFFSISAQVAGYEPVFEGEGLDEKCIDYKTNKVLCVVNKDYYRPSSIVNDSKGFYRPSDVVYLNGDNTKIKTELGWECHTKYDKLAEIMTKFDLDNYKK